MKYHLIYNPIAGKGRAKKAINLVSKYLKENNIDFEVHVTQREKDAISMVHSLTSDGVVKTLIVFGGDGTLSEVVNGIVDFDKTYLSLVPCGSGNDFSANFNNLNVKKPIETIKTILKNNVKKIDYLLVNDKWRCINTIGFGIDTEVLLRYRRSRIGTINFRYKIAVLLSAIFLKWHYSRVKIDDSNEERKKTAFFSISNGKEMGSGLKMCPHAKVDDGEISYLSVNHFPKWKLAYALFRVNSGTVDKLKFISMGNCKKVELELDNGTFETDGELFENVPNIVVTVGKEKINFIC